MPVAHLGIAIRPDPGFAELVAVGLEPTAVDALAACLAAAARESRSHNARYLGTNPINVNGADAVLAQVGFKQPSEELLLVKGL